MRNILRSMLILGLVGLAGCQAPEPAAEEAAAVPSPSSNPSPIPSSGPAPEPGASTDALTNTVWMRTEGEGPPGELRIFLTDGTLVQTSCVEVYALRTWRRVSETEIVFVEEVEIPARIVALTADELRLSLSLIGGERQEVVYHRARVPYICPDNR